MSFKHIKWNGFKYLLKLSHALLNQDWILSEVFKWLRNLYLLLHAYINSENFTFWDFDFERCTSPFEGHPPQSQALLSNRGVIGEAKHLLMQQGWFSVCTTQTLRIWLCGFFCWSFWNLFSLVFMVTSEGLSSVSAEITSSSSGVRSLAWSIPLTREILPGHSIEALWLQWLLKYKRYSLLYILSRALDNSKSKSPLYVTQNRAFHWFYLCPGSVWLEEITWTFHASSQDLS